MIKYLCPFCDKSFNDKQTCRRHVIQTEIINKLMSDETDFNIKISRDNNIEKLYKWGIKNPVVKKCPETLSH